MDNKRLEEYSRELQNSMNNVKSLIAQAQVTMGVVESFLYLVRKESAKEEVKEIPKEG